MMAMTIAWLKSWSETLTSIASKTSSAQRFHKNAFLLPMS